MAQKKWSELSETQQRLIILAGIAELAMTSAAIRDLMHRPAAQVRGPKLVWAAAFVVQPFGPLAYLLAGRR
ncbi:PLDc N-terminal domain-containing protein [Nocardioides sp.]|uniref:PLDc N-terminal domain-containing protein n=1 Tax=Nocardioides sp. TaxID=35761 RepID=UPI003D0CF406